MPDQARRLVDKIQADKVCTINLASYTVENIVFLLQKNVNIEEDWKLITLWIGGNDLCAVCKGSVSHYSF